MPRIYSRPQERQRRAVRRILDRGPIWNAATMRIDRDGVITAKRDPEKTFRTEDGSVQVVGTVRDIIGEDYHQGRN